jgi:ferrochelatase
MSRTAVVLFNLGGPDSLDAVRPFLFNLFNDPAIIAAPWPIRFLLATYLSRKRAPIARQIYMKIGERSPLLEQTQAQAQALEAELGPGHKTFIAMRYWHPFASEALKQARDYQPDRIVLLPLYPQYSSTTSGSSLAEWRKLAQDWNIPTAAVCCWPEEAGLIAATAERVRQSYEKAWAHGLPRVLFSAHGLPKKVIASGDPYQRQVERSASAVVAALGIAKLDWAVCYQSRVGPLEWIGPSTQDELARAGRDKVPVVVVPIAFVSEHSETLVELDIEYRHQAQAFGVPAYERVPTPFTHLAFIQGLARLVRNARAGETAPGGADCGKAFAKCPRSLP